MEVWEDLSYTNIEEDPRKKKKKTLKMNSTSIFLLDPLKYCKMVRHNLAIGLAQMLGGLS